MTCILKVTCLKILFPERTKLYHKKLMAPSCICNMCAHSCVMKMQREEDCKTICRRGDQAVKSDRS